MNEEEIVKLVDKLLCDYGYTRKFPVHINNRLSRTRGRVCFNRNRVITRMDFSKYLLNCSKESIEDTVRHEVAHAIVLLETHRDHGHDAYWKQWAVRLGANPSSSTYDPAYHNQLDNDMHYFAYCHQCGQLVGEAKTAGCRFVKYPTRYHSTCCKASLDIERTRRIQKIAKKEVVYTAKFTELASGQLVFDF